MPQQHSLQPETREVQFQNAQFLPEVVKLLNEGHTVTINLRGVSMRPFLEDGRDKAVLIRPLIRKSATLYSRKSPRASSCSIASIA